VAGAWSADVTYDWGDKYTEGFTFKVDGNEILGTASFLGSPRGIVGGSIVGDRVTFLVRTQEVLGDDKPTDVVHKYRGTVSGNTIAFLMQSEGGSGTGRPIEFAATRQTGRFAAGVRPLKELRTGKIRMGFVGSSAFCP
jgi:hypothetical protein